jgi:ABC-type amino acid transport substrate-binding protein
VGDSHVSRLPLRRRLGALAFVGAALAAWQAPGRPLETVKQTGTLRVAVYQDYKPYSWRKDGKPVGIDVEIAQRLAETLGVRLDLFELRADDDINDDLRNGVWRGSLVGAAPGDVMLHVPYDKRIEAGNDRVALFAPYHVDGMAMVVDPSKAVAASDLSLLKSEKAAVAVGTIGDMILISLQDHALQPNVVHERTLEQAAQDYEQGRVAAFYGEASAAQAFARAGARPFALVYPKTGLGGDWPIGVAVKADSRDLGEAVAASLRRFSPATASIGASPKRRADRIWRGGWSVAPGKGARRGSGAGRR